MIGIFDSGIGGLSIWQEITKLMPSVDTVYLADQFHAPYGTKSSDYLKDRGIKITRFFESLGIKLIVIACNTATVNITIDNLRRSFPGIRFVGVEPPVKPLAALTKTGEIAIFATPATCKSTRTKDLINSYCPQQIVHLIPTPEWAPLVETGKFTSTESDPQILKYLQPLRSTATDRIGLGCTHYHFLLDKLNRLSAAQFEFIDISQPVAKRTKILGSHQALASGRGRHRFLTTAAAGRLQIPLKRLLQIESTVESINI
jgi:glutamate racemase